MKCVIVQDGKVLVGDDRWITIGGEDEDGSGQHVLIKENGTITAGFGTGKNVKNVFSEKNNENGSAGSKGEAPKKPEKPRTENNPDDVMGALQRRKIERGNVVVQEPIEERRIAKLEKERDRKIRDAIDMQEAARIEKEYDKKIQAVRAKYQAKRDEEDRKFAERRKAASTAEKAPKRSETEQREYNIYKRYFTDQYIDMSDKDKVSAKSLGSIWYNQMSEKLQKAKSELAKDPSNEELRKKVAELQGSRDGLRELYKRDAKVDIAENETTTLTPSEQYKLDMERTENRRNAAARRKEAEKLSPSEQYKQDMERAERRREASARRNTESYQGAKEQTKKWRFDESDSQAPKKFADMESEAKEMLSKAKEKQKKWPKDKDVQREVDWAEGLVDGYAESRKKMSSAFLEKVAERQGGTSPNAKGNEPKKMVNVEPNKVTISKQSNSANPKTAKPKEPKSANIKGGRRLEYDDDVVKIYRNGKLEYHGIEDDSPYHRDDNWKWNASKGYYEIDHPTGKYVMVVPK